MRGARKLGALGASVGTYHRRPTPRGVRLSARAVGGPRQTQTPLRVVVLPRGAGHAGGSSPAQLVLGARGEHPRQSIGKVNLNWGTLGAVLWGVGKGSGTPFHQIVPFLFPPLFILRDLPWYPMCSSRGTPPREDVMWQVTPLPVPRGNHPR